MGTKLLTLIILFFAGIICCNTVYARKKSTRTHKRRTVRVSHYKINIQDFHSINFDTDSISGDSIINFAQTLIGTRYRSATSDPLVGFDCSGFVHYVFKYFNVEVPRSSGDFIDVGEKIKLEDAMPGDIIVFTSPTDRHRIGHVGIVFHNDSDSFTFIHSTSGKEHGVTITAMDDTYRRRFVQVIRVLKHNNRQYAYAMPAISFYSLALL
ncbi:MAG TPA: C40 family peptidase [Mucilaginibacter sp.]|nr:C40 family peptidase [Mucilaginibacter sp.]